MSKQLDLFLAEIDREATKAAVESELNKYRFLLLTTTDDMTPKITPEYSMVPPSPNNSFHSTTEDIAIKRADMEVHRSKFIKRIAMAVNRLGYMERSIIVSRYMKEDDVYDYEVYNQLGMSESKY
ncbi:ArpU family phage packaging/lysis transcriptional regulator [Bacillus sp. FJAT-52991]|uniref:ArpU family phage packaging/lysis transcriptional regulator n=1 Tax=Bacillus kandeliae TaxID=3129297 RepID=A0ABZ2NA93_9BACI